MLVFCEIIYTYQENTKAQLGVPSQLCQALLFFLSLLYSSLSIMDFNVIYPERDAEDHR